MSAQRISQVIPKANPRARPSSCTTSTPWGIRRTYPVSTGAMRVQGPMAEDGKIQRAGTVILHEAEAMATSRRHNLLSRSAARRLRLCVVAAAAAAAVLAGCGSGGSSNSKSAATVESPKASLHGAVANPPFQARDLVLNDSLGHRVDLAQYRGKAVLVTFIYTHCPDVCP